ncbi:hypothetical protein IEQ44_09645 [Nocardioides sp. Y6]|uniref:Aromatic ring-opening dioxygenase LigA n=1 Tax=Nocardioides malaquae TaxID=2773426 RepID=A0ABR9RTK3_9ACTN|nr:hypothetical protein [Nocardioides malaquae]MBE7324919.1 hypothetical protein [Nocardioides malaquae]
MRATLDKLISWTGILLALVLLVAGGLLTWGATFIGDQVDQQFGDQDITMPTKEAIEADESLSDEDRDTLMEFEGTTLDNGPKARAYADHYIKAHMEASTFGVKAALEEKGVNTDEMTFPLTYESAGGVARAVEADTELNEADKAELLEAVGANRDSLFKGNTLRGLLLYGYAFATMGTIAGYAAIGAFVGAALFLILGILGLVHARKAAEARV